MTDAAPAIAAATLDHSERIRLLTEAVEKQRRTITKMSLVLGLLVAVGIPKWISGLFREETILHGSALALQSKGTKTAFLLPAEDGLSVVFEGGNGTPSGATLKADGEGLALVSAGKVLWKSQ